MKAPRWVATGFWISTALFALQMGFTAYAQLRLPQVAAAFVHLGFPAYFRIELSWAKFAGWAAGTAVLWGLSYFFFRRQHNPTQANTELAWSAVRTG